MSKFVDLTGSTFGNWKVLSLESKGTNQHSKYRCRCLLCNREYIVDDYSLKSGRSTKCRSCGTRIGKTKEYSKDPIKGVLVDMKQRCYNPNQLAYKYYGAKGITICDEWLNNPKSFYDWSYENGYKKGMSIERKDIKKGYSPENCTFIPLKDQSKNRSVSYMITINGKTQCLADWCRELNLKYKTVFARIKRGIDSIEALY